MSGEKVALLGQKCPFSGKKWGKNQPWRYYSVTMHKSYPIDSMLLIQYNSGEKQVFTVRGGGGV
jgi:hypothetical protein